MVEWLGGKVIRRSTRSTAGSAGGGRVSVGGGRVAKRNARASRKVKPINI